MFSVKKLRPNGYRQHQKGESVVDKVFSIVKQNNATFKAKQKNLTLAISYGSSVWS